MLELDSSLAMLEVQHASVAEASLSQGTEVRAAPYPVVVTGQHSLICFACLMSDHIPAIDSALCASPSDVHCVDSRWRAFRESSRRAGRRSRQRRVRWSA